MELNGRHIRAMIFDLDGTLLESTSVWSDVDTNFFKRRKMTAPSWYSKKISTMGIQKAAEFTKEYFHLPETPEEMIHEWLDEVIKQYSEEIPLKAHAKELLDYAKTKGISINVATANSEECYMPALIRLDIHKDFDHIVDVRNYKDGKDSPEVYLDIAKRLGIKPEEILVFEDSPKAASVAKLAGFGLVCVKDNAWSLEDEKEKQDIADFYLEDFAQIQEVLKD